jgi:cytochrome c oxidase subunit 2
VRTLHRFPSRRAAVLVGVGVLAVVAGGCASSFGAPEPVSEQGDAMTDTWRVFLIGAVLVAGLVWGLVIWSVLRYRRRGADDTHIPPQRQYNIPLEAVYTIAPILIVAVLFAITIVNVERLDAGSADPDVTVEVVGFQWSWQFRYADDGIVVNGTEDARPVLMLPVGRTVRFELRTADVIHSFWVPEFLTKKDLIPRVDNAIDVHITEAGEWTGRCAEYCGFDHWKMAFDVRAVPADEYDRWVEDASRAPQPILGQL